MDKKPLIILTGPTAVGKTDLSIALAKAIGGSIISADSMQVYKHMDIGSAKISPGQMQGISHYLIDCLEPWEEFNVVVFQRMAKQALAEIYEKGMIPILTGGTGFYIQALLNDIDFTDCDDDPVYREELEKLAQTHGSAHLYEMLKSTDPESAAAIHPNNVKRVIRALEFYKKTGKKISEHNKQERQKKSAYNSAYFVLNLPRPILYDRIDKRVDQMMRDGLLFEVESLLKMGCTKQMVSMQGLGYKEMIDHLQGRITLEEAVYRIKRETRHFAKRQLTWFKREKDVIWLNKEDYADESALLMCMLHILKSKQISTD